MKEITRYVSILTLNVNRLNFPIKRHHLANWIKKEDSTICCLQENHLNNRKMEEDLPSHWPLKTSWSNNIYIRQSRIQMYIGQTKGHFILIHQKEITINNLYAPNVRTHNFIKNTLKD
jgi:exonuclease III